MTHEEPTFIRKTLRYRGPAFSVYEYETQIGGRIVKRDIIERKHGVVIVPVDTEHNVLLIREFCAGSNSFILSLPGGSIEGDEPSADAMRELREETGYRAARLIKLRFSYSHPSTSNRKSYVFLGYDLIFDPLVSEDEIIQPVRLPLDEAIATAYRDFESDGGTVGTLLMARDKIREMGL